MLSTTGLRKVIILALWFVSGWNNSVELTRERLSLIKIDLERAPVPAQDQEYWTHSVMDNEVVFKTNGE